MFLVQRLQPSIPIWREGRDRLLMATYCHRHPNWEVDVYVALMSCEPDSLCDESLAMMHQTMHQFLRNP